MPKEYDFIKKRITKNLGSGILSTTTKKHKETKKDDRFPEGNIAPKGWHAVRVIGP